jgi:diadenosine tetraphosphatase ApaH/serine/threonine PP2A family protein phosphatase
MTPVCFHGHTHCPMIYEKSMNGVFRIDAQDFKLPIGRKYFINVGSVGQPRDGDPRATYVIYDPKERMVRYRRLEYDVAAAQERIRLAGLPERLAARLAVGQ